MEWRDGEETWYSTLRRDPFCTVFQTEMVALQRAIRRMKNSKDGLVSIFSNFKFSLKVLTGPRTNHPLGHKPRRDISEIVTEGRAMCLFWVRVHAGIAGNERDRRAALTKKRAADYDRFPLSHAKKEAYMVLSKIEITSQVAQTLTNHGGFARYLYGFKVRVSSYCACDPAKIQDVQHVLEDCDMFHRERELLEAGIDVRIARRNFPEILEDAGKRERFLTSCGMVVE
ncbi:hypothetical protein EVAR_57131_1 [Eumeta japonica]|uniref:RNase H type-1 domain-containing protein n=1 Tax=Eumeta variegata TaxID=151549 RepID=A0A4C1YVG5_EUMVA|nr:hypothetical protein EVAR_57131_1 [Eumeta japonica]